MEWFDYIAASLFTLLGMACLGLVLIGMPGTWLIILMAIALEFVQRLWAPAGSPYMFSIWVLVAAVIIGGLGEVFELIAGAFGAKKGGASKKGMFGALIGGIVGALLCIPIIPPIGSLLGAFIGCGAGAIIGELSNANDVKLKDTLKPAAGAVIGRVLGTLAKLPCSIAVWLTLSIAAFWR